MKNIYKPLLVVLMVSAPWVIWAKDAKRGDRQSTTNDQQQTTDDKRPTTKDQQTSVANTQSLSAGVSQAQEILSRLNKNLESFGDFSVQVQEKSDVFGPEGKKSSSGISNLRVKKDMRYSEQVISREGIQSRIVHVFDGRRFWTYDERAKTARKVELNSISKELRDKFKAKMAAENMNVPGLDYKVTQQSIGGRNCYVLESQKPFTSGNQVFDKVRMTIESGKDGLLPYKQEMTTRLIVKIPYGKNMEIKTETVQEYTNWKFNTGIKDYEFTIALPSDVQVLDDTEAAKGMLVRVTSDEKQQTTDDKKQTTEDNKRPTTNDKRQTTGAGVGH